MLRRLISPRTSSLALVSASSLFPSLGHRIAPPKMATANHSTDAMLKVAAAGGVSASTAAQQPPWHQPVPAKGSEPRQLHVYNSLTRSKTPFVPLRGKHVTWYNCGPTVYDASHMGHARNYVSQDIIRRIMRDYFGFSIHFVMNITDIDDKIILKARHSHLLEQFRAQNPALTTALLSTVRSAWSAFFVKNLKSFAPPPPPEEPREPEDEPAWEEISRLWTGDAKWKEDVKAKQPKFEMWWKALDSSRQAQVAAAMAVAGSPSKDPELAKQLIDASVDVLAPFLDAESGSGITDPSIFRQTAAFWETAYFDDMKALHVEPPTTLTRVSEYVPEIVTFVERIVGNGFAYRDDKGNVWFDTRRFDGAERDAKGASADGQGSNHSYAKLAPWSKGNKELIEEGEGSLSTAASTTSGKRSASDFALWKSSKPGEPAWPSPWGPGRPGWHIECSVMASEVLGERMDIHSGGVDLMFPHHDNELAQSEAHHGCGQWVNYFLHTGHLHIEGLKMSKSLKNFITIQEALERFSARQLRLAFLLQPWSSKMDFKESGMNEVRGVETAFDNFFNTTKALMREVASRGPSWSDGQHHYGAPEKALMAAFAEAQEKFDVAMADSFDTQKGIEVLLDLVSKANVYERSTGRKDVNVGTLEAVARWTGDMLRMFGLGEGVVREGAVGWGEASRAGQEGSGDREEILMPYLTALSSFRDAVRQLARKGASAGEILQLADKLRDQDMVDLGVAMEDQEDGRALIKLVDAEKLKEAREEKEREKRDKAARKAEAAEKARVARLERLEKGRTPPELLFKPPTEGSEEYSAWDEKGLPTLDKEGKELAKKRRQRCEKERNKQETLHKEFLEAREKGEIQ